MAASPALTGLLSVLTGSDTMMNKNNVLILLLAGLLSGCGSDDDSVEKFSIPTPGPGFGADNDISQVSYNTQESQPAFSQRTCSSSSDSYPKQQQIRFFDGNNIEMAVRAYRNSNCSSPIELIEYHGKFEIKGDHILPDGEHAVRIEVIFTQAWSTLLDQARVDARNGPKDGGAVCDRKDWALNKRIDISNLDACSPLFPISERRQFRLVRKQAKDFENRIFLDNPDRVYPGETYPYQLDTTPFFNGSL